MTWVKCLVMVLGMTLVAQVVLARDIESFTDKQGVLHITNLGSKSAEGPGKPGDPLVPAAPRAGGKLPGGHTPGGAGAPGSAPRGSSPKRPPPNLSPRRPPAPNPKAHSTAPQPEAVAPAPATPEEGQVPAPQPEAQHPAPQPEAGPAEPAPEAPGPGSRVTHGAVAAGVIPAAAGSGPPGAAVSPAGPAAPGIKRVSWSPPLEPARPVARGGIVTYRDGQGVLHITNVAREAEEPAAPVIPAPAAPRQARAREPAFPAVQKVALTLPAGAPGLCPELGSEVAAYLADRLQGAAADSTGASIQRYRDEAGVWHIGNEPAPELVPAQSAGAATALAVPAAAHGPPASPPLPAGGPGFIRPPPGAAAPTVVARRDRRGVLHIFSQGPGEPRLDGGDPALFVRRIPPALQACIGEASRRYGLPVSLVLAVIRQESDFVHQAVSPKGAMGLMQLMPGTAASLGVRDPFDPRENILAGCRHFRFLLDYFHGNLPLALAGYNAGQHRVVAAGCQVPAIKETQEFVTQVMGLYYLLEKHASSL